MQTFNLGKRKDVTWFSWALYWALAFLFRVPILLPLIFVIELGKLAQKVGDYLNRRLPSVDKVQEL